MTTINVPDLVGFDEDERLLEHIPRLPPHAREIMARREEERLEIQVRNDARSARIRRYSGEKQDATLEAARLKRLKESNSVNWTVEAQTELTSAEERLAHATAKIQKLQPAQKKKTPALSAEELARAKLLNDFAPSPESVLARQPQHWRAKTKRAELPSGNLKKAFADVTARETAIVERLVALEFAPLTEKEGFKAIDDAVDARARRGAVDVSGVARFSASNLDGRKAPGSVLWPTGSYDDRKSLEPKSGELGVAFHCWLFPDQVKSRLKAELRAHMKDRPEGVSAVEREHEARRLRAELLDVQRLKVRIAEELEVDPGRVHPFALLGIERGKDAPRTERQIGGVEMKGGAATLGASHSGLNKSAE